MTYKISDDRKRLTICVDSKERAELIQLFNEKGDSDAVMWQAFEPLICNSELEWVKPEQTGDLTDAPMLGILGDEGCRQHWALRKHFGLVESGQGDDNTLYRGIVERWAFMDYQVRSVLEDLRDKGQAIFTS